jgi:hypothetical protein
MNADWWVLEWTIARTEAEGFDLDDLVPIGQELELGIVLRTAVWLHENQRWTIPGDTVREAMSSELDMTAARLHLHHPRPYR